MPGNFVYNADFANSQEQNSTDDYEARLIAMVTIFTVGLVGG